MFIKGATKTALLCLAFTTRTRASFSAARLSFAETKPLSTVQVRATNAPPDQAEIERSLSKWHGHHLWRKTRTVTQRINGELHLRGLKKWGFVIYRCTYEDDAAWDRFMAHWHEQILISLRYMKYRGVLDGK